MVRGKTSEEAFYWTLFNGSNLGLILNAINGKFFITVVKTEYFSDTIEAL